MLKKSRKVFVAFISSLGIFVLMRHIHKFMNYLKKNKSKQDVKYTYGSIHEWLKDNGDDRYGWQIHFDYFHRIISEKMMRSEEQYTDLEIKLYIFNAWLAKVPSYLKMGDALENGFKKQVRRYIQDKYDFDPFAYEANTTTDNIPTAEQLKEWWNM